MCRVLVISEQVLESMYRDFIRKCGRGEAVTYAAYRAAFIQETGYAVESDERSAA